MPLDLQEEYDEPGEQEKTGEEVLTEENVVSTIIDHAKGDPSPEDIRLKAEEERKKFEGLLNPLSSVIFAGKKHFDVDATTYIDTPTPELDIGNIAAGMNNVELTKEVWSVYDTNKFDNGCVRNIVIKDDTGKTQVTAWDQSVDAFDELSRGDKVRIEKGYTKTEVSDWQKKKYNGIPSVQLGDESRLVKIKEEGENEVLIESV